MQSSIGRFVAAITVITVMTTSAAATELTEEQIDNIVRRSYQYVAMYNVNNKFALKQGGWNTMEADTRLKDHTMREIARPNNDTLYISCLLDLRKDPVILKMPAFDSKYVSLMITGYDHYVNSVGENAGMKLDDKGGIEIHIAAEAPEGVPEENWLPINRKDEEIGVIMRIYVPDLEKMKTWEPPKAELLK